MAILDVLFEEDNVEGEGRRWPQWICMDQTEVGYTTYTCNNNTKTKKRGGGVGAYKEGVCELDGAIV